MDNRLIQSKFIFEEQPPLEAKPSDLITIKEASDWASNFTGKSVTNSNISYLVQYGLIRKYGENGVTRVSIQELIDYYHSHFYKRKEKWNQKLGSDIDWHLSFENVKEADTTKHVHRLHPYKGKFIPQLVEYFLDEKTDEYKTGIYFHPGDIILDPFCGSGTTLIQANELGIHAIGIDISAFNALISNVKVKPFNYFDLNSEIQRVTNILKTKVLETRVSEFEERLLSELYYFNTKYFPTPEFRYKALRNEIDSDNYGKEQEKNFIEKYYKLVKEYNISVDQDNIDSYLDKWFLKPIRLEINLAHNEIEKTKNEHTRNILRIILSRTIRSCRATTHSDLATLIEPQTTTYYCPKHWKICKPLFSIVGKWTQYSKDTLNRLALFNKLRTDTFQFCINGDSQTINIIEALECQSKPLSELASKQRLKGIFSSPPYVGMIDYHEQHAYSYELFGIPRNDELEIGPLFKGQGLEAKELYVLGIAAVLKNSKKYLTDDYDVFLVANDKYDLYPKIAELSGMQIVNVFKRPVLNRSERDKGAYSESIFHCKEK